MPQFSERTPFSCWARNLIPSVASGVYAIWEKDKLIYCGMSGVGFDKDKTQIKRKYGLVNRLNSHASGRLSGDQFCVYVANRLVIPEIKLEQLAEFSSVKLTLDQLTKAYIHNRLDFQFAVTRDGIEAQVLEEICRSGKYFGTKPFLNPF